MITGFLFLASFIQFYWLYRLIKKSDEHNARLTTLERRDHEKRVQAQEKSQPKQIFEKPIVKNAKEVKPLEIGDGRMRFDPDAQVAEWV